MKRGYEERRGGVKCNTGGRVKGGRGQVGWKMGEN